MSVYVSAYVWKHSQAKGSTLLVLLALADIADDDGLVPAHRSSDLAHLAKKTRLDPRTIRYCLRELEGEDQHDKDQKLIRPGLKPAELATETGNGRRPSKYQILMRQLGLEFSPGATREDHSLPEEVVDKSKRERNGDSSQTGTVQPVRGGENDIERGTGVPPTTRSDVTTRKGRKADPPPKAVEKSEPQKPYTPSSSVIGWASDRGYTPYLHLHVEHFRNYIAEPKVRARYTDLDAAFRNAVLGDWGNVRQTAQRAARDGRGADLERWWMTPEGFKAKGVGLGIAWTVPQGAPAQDTANRWYGYMVDVLDAAVDADGWGAWVDQERQQQHFEWVVARRKRLGKDYPGMAVERQAA